ncbi:MAG TPA: molybdate ABC transporter substrate-binding protein [Xanthobacteraceae bacterium]|jgi:molybdate transport system substrate-binding protein
MDKSSVAAALLVLAMALPAGRAGAAELKVLAGGSMTASLQALGPSFERATGHTLVFRFAGTPELIKLATSDAPFDLGVVPVDVMKDAAARSRFAPGPATDVARVGYGVAVRAGAPKPDVSSPEALKATLLRAQSVALLPESAAGAYVLNVFERLGITEAMKPKIKPQTVTGQIPQAVARGDAELGVFLTNVLAAPGVELAGPFPAELQQNLVFAAAVAAATREAVAAQAFIDYLKTPEAAAVLRAKGMTPG